MSKSEGALHPLWRQDQLNHVTNAPELIIIPARGAGLYPTLKACVRILRHWAALAMIHPSCTIRLPDIPVVIEPPPHEADVYTKQEERVGTANTILTETNTKRGTEQIVLVHPGYEYATHASCSFPLSIRENLARV